jgi:hypothetical protein
MRSKRTSQFSWKQHSFLALASFAALTSGCGSSPQKIYVPPPPPSLNSTINITVVASDSKTPLDGYGVHIPPLPVGINTIYVSTPTDKNGNASIELEFFQSEETSATATIVTYPESCGLGCVVGTQTVNVIGGQNASVTIVTNVAPPDGD